MDPNPIQLVSLKAERLGLWERIGMCQGEKLGMQAALPTEVLVLDFKPLEL